MEWLSENWFLTVLIIAFVAMHFFGHGHHHGGKSKHGSSGSCTHDEQNQKSFSPD